MARSLATRILDANAALIAKGDLRAVDELFSADYVAHVTEQDLTGGPAWVRKYLETLRAAFPDLKTEVEILMEGKDRVAWQRTLRGTHTGPYQGFPATGRKLVWRDMVVSRLQGDLIAEEWVITDMPERLLRARK